MVRYFNASGDDREGEVGESHQVETHLIPRAMMAIQGHVNDFRVFGSDFPTHDGTAIRDYVHVSDLAAMHVLAVGRLLEGERGGTYNLGVGAGYSAGQVLGMISDVSGIALPALVSSRRPGDSAELVSDASRARLELGFDPVNSDRRTIVETAWRWHLQAHPQRQPAAGSGMSDV